MGSGFLSRRTGKSPEETRCDDGFPLEDRSPEPLGFWSGKSKRKPDRFSLAGVLARADSLTLLGAVVWGVV